ncbi:DUF2974 domain-containing protein [Lactobacillus ultunensis]|uniref:Uncharacterized protein n=1 Tax=Lactobacillus ultunensis DSM 16047 TaxID=525365 RepID=C2ENU7_9LACO|nr:DUF2974 domain-containing protein [Lactobacillus ultunensis]EEJ71730.1 hypothetical protein HMPREF0548_1343 [Lactobacillus ultunensis DSM 16047]KRL82170.1 hypothetical protein FC57_GL002000 [Lactobacillus ultunensis DSM 16047]QQP28561.1 DUF2974 domain-containing protein [Lactobacillus ultunensis]
MAGTLDYLRWRGDLSFKEKTFNNVDASLLASIIYLPVDHTAKGHTLSEVAEKLRKLPSFQVQMQDLAGTQVLLLPPSPRLGNIKVLNWTNRLEKDPYPLQFTAATFRLTPDTIIIVYRGTDSSIIGWNEDMNMNYMPKVYGQDVAANYLKEMAQEYPHDKIYLAGHSKGGNYAEYALSVAEPELQDRIIRALSFDGPGFFHQVWKSPGFVRAESKMKTYLPESSIIGTMLDHPERVIIVKSTAPMLQQHDPRRWSVGRDSFVLAESLTSGARSLRHSFIDFNHSIPDKQRGELWDALFQAFDDLNITDVFQITAHKLIGTVRFSRAIMSLTPETRKYVLHMIGEIINAIRGNISLPFNETDFALYPKSNDSNKAPIFFEFYDTTVPSILPEEIKQRFKEEKEKEKREGKEQDKNKGKLQ